MLTRTLALFTIGAACLLYASTGSAVQGASPQRSGFDADLMLFDNPDALDPQEQPKKGDKGPGGKGGSKGSKKGGFQGGNKGPDKGKAPGGKGGFKGPDQGGFKGPGGKGGFKGGFGKGGFPGGPFGKGGFPGGPFDKGDFKKPEAPKTDAPAATKDSAGIEARIDRLIQELEALRKDIRAQKK